MKGLSMAGDPNNEDSPLSQALPNWPKQDMIGRIHSVISVDVITRVGIEASVRVLSNWREKGVFSIELSAENMDSLLERHSAESSPWIPRIDQSDSVRVCNLQQI